MMGWQFEIFAEQPRFQHLSTTRHGGVSHSPFDTLNLGDGVGDDEEAVRTNRKRVQQHVGCTRLLYAQQVHGTTLHEVTSNSPECVPDCDGFLLTQPGQAAMIKHADCQATIFYDPIRHVAAVVHAGWRGLVQTIYAKTIAALGSRPENLLVAIAPSLGPDAAEFIHYRTEFPESFWEFQTKPNHFDLWAIAEHQLISAGILAHHLQIRRLCTYAHPEDYFSFRRARTGRQGTLSFLL